MNSMCLHRVYFLYKALENKRCIYETIKIISKYGGKYMNKIFPKDFWWGAATSGPQCEGRFNKPHKNVFDYWFDIEPNKFFNEVGPNVASNFYNSYESESFM